MVKKDNPKNITFNLGSEVPMIGAGKKRRGRRKKETNLTEVLVKEQLPHQKFSHKTNKALDQLLEANREKEKAEIEKGLKAIATMRGTGDTPPDDDWFADILRPREKELKDLPQFGSTTLKIPPFFAVPTQKGWRLANPLTEIRNLAQRQHKLSLMVKRSNVKKPEIDMSIPRKIPDISDFPEKDQRKLRAYLDAVKEGKEQQYLYKNKPRGFPAVLYKNAKKAGYKETDEKVYRKNDLKAKKAPSKVPVGRPSIPRRRLQIEGDSDIEDETTSDLEDEETAKEQRERRAKATNRANLTDAEWEKETENDSWFSGKVRWLRGNPSSSIRGEAQSHRTMLERLKPTLNSHDKKILAKQIELFKEIEKEGWKAFPAKYKTELEEAWDTSKRERETRAKKVEDFKKEAKELTAELTSTLPKERRKQISKRIEEMREERKEWKDYFSYNEETRELFNELVHKYNAVKGKGLKMKMVDMTKMEDKYDSNSDSDEGEAGSLLGNIAHKAYNALVKPKVEAVKKNIHRITHPKETLQEAKDFGRHLIHGRHDAYPPSAQKVIDENKDAIVEHIALHRNPLPSAYTKIMSWATKGETDKRIAEQPKDTLYHIGMWVKLSNGKTIKVEKNEVINIDPNPKKPKEEEVFQVPNPPSGLTFGEMLSKTREAVGDHKFFSYSAKDNNCGNFIEYILKTNGMDSPATHDFIGQDAKAILKGFPSLRKFMNTLTDTAGRANVLLEGGDIDAVEQHGGSVEKIDWEDMKWGSFTKQFEEYKRQHPNSKIDDLEHFAESILANPSDYKKTTLKRARFYLNVIAKKKLSHHNNIMPTQGGRMIGLARPAVLPAHIGHPALVSDQYPRIPQAFTQVHLASPVPIGHGLYAGGGGSGGDLLDDIYGGARHLLGVGVRPMPVAMRGGDIWGDIGRAFDPKKNGVAKAFDPKQNGVSNAFNKTFTPQLGRDITSGLIHQALPAVISGVAGSATSALTGNPALGFAVGQTAGKYAGKEAGDALGKATGYGLGGKMPRFKKGSKEAKEYMASIRRKKGSKGGAIPAPHSRGIITDPSLL